MPDAVKGQRDTPGPDPAGMRLIRANVAGKWIDVDICLGNPKYHGKAPKPSEVSDADILRSLAAASRKHIGGSRAAEKRAPAAKGGGVRTPATAARLVP